MWQLREIFSSTFALVALGCSIASATSIQNYSLPFSSIIPAFNLVLAVLCLAWALFGRTKRLTYHEQPRLFLSLFLSYVALILPVVLAVLSAPYVFSGGVRVCSTELQWKNWYVGKNEVMIRSIQNTLRCCGFNSMPDRAWPFPSRDSDARTCQRTSGFRLNCAPLWQQQLRVVAILCMLAGMLVHLSVLLFVYDILRFSDMQTVGSHEHANEERVRLLGSTTPIDPAQAVFEEERRRQMVQGLP